MSNRYNIKSNIWAGMCVFVVVDTIGSPTEVGTYATLDAAIGAKDGLNAKDEAAKAEFDTVHHMRHNGINFKVHGTADAMAAFRSMNAMRVKHNQEMQQRVVASQDEIAQLRKQLHLAKLDVAEAERLRGVFADYKSKQPDLKPFTFGPRYGLGTWTVYGDEEARTKLQQRFQDDHEAITSAREIERLRMEQGVVYPVTLVDGVTHMSGRHLAERVEALIGEVQGAQRERAGMIERLAKQASSILFKGSSAECWYNSWRDLADKCNAFTKEAACEHLNSTI